MSPILVKTSLEEGPISQKIAKKIKISHFCGRKTLRNVSPGFAKILEKKNRSISLFWGRNRKLEMGSGFRTRALHPVKINLSTHPGVPPARVANSDSW